SAEVVALTASGTMLWLVRNESTSHGEPVRLAGFSPDGTYVAVIGDNVLTIWNALDARLEVRVSLSEVFNWRPGVVQIAFSPDERYLGLGFLEHAGVLALPSGNVIQQVTHYAEHGIAETLVAVGSNDIFATAVGGEVRLWGITGHASSREYPRLSHGAEI